VKGLGATKVTSLVDAFNKPFLVGGLKREPADGTDSPANKRMRTDGPGAEDGGVAAASPEWPEILDDEPEDDDADDGDAEPSRGRERVPSRSPGAASNGRAADESQEGTTRGASPLAAWQDPLDDADEDGDAVDDSDDSVAGQTARNLQA
jgi:DNA excision repair protein ERCC-1